MAAGWQLHGDLARGPRREPERRPPEYREHTCGTISTECGSSASHTTASPDASENASTTSSGAPPGEDARYAGTPPLGPMTSALASAPEAMVNVPRAAAAPPCDAPGGKIDHANVVVPNPGAEVTGG
jgi:hypothetical protein